MSTAWLINTCKKKLEVSSLNADETVYESYTIPPNYRVRGTQPYKVEGKASSNYVYLNCWGFKWRVRANGTSVIPEVCR
jgi:hypothetical protein